MKKRKILIIGFILLYGLFIGYKYQLRQQIPPKDDQETLTVVTSFYPMYMHTRELIKGTPHTLVNMASQTVGCLHDYQLTVQDAKKLYEADVLVINGLGSENFIEKAYKQNNTLKVIDASVAMEPYLHEGEEVHTEHEEEVASETGHEHGHEHNHDGINDHIWMSIDGSIMQIQQIAKELMTIDPTYAHTYEANAKAYIAALQVLKEEALQSFEGEKETLKVVSVHNAFTYMLEELGIQVIETIPEGSYENASAKQIEHLIEHMEEEQVEVVVTEAKNKDLALLKMLQKQMAYQLYVLDALVNVDESVDLDKDRPFEYVVRMQKNIETLKEAFKYE